MSGPRKTPTLSSMEHAADRTERAVIGAEVAGGHFPTSLPSYLYNRGTNALIRRSVPPQVFHHPPVQNVLRARSIGLAAFGLGLTALALWSHSKKK